MTDHPSPAQHSQTTEEQKRIQLKTNFTIGTSAQAQQSILTRTFDIGIFHRVFQLLFPVFVWILWFCAFTWVFLTVT
jgi:hypothetical protein